jgi:hypothetical protein
LVPKERKIKNLALKDTQNWRSCSLTMWLSSVTEKNRIIIFTSTTMLQIDPKQKFLIAFYFPLAFLSRAGYPICIGDQVTRAGYCMYFQLDCPCALS